MRNWPLCCFSAFCSRSLSASLSICFPSFSFNFQASLAGNFVLDIFWPKTQYGSSWPDILKLQHGFTIVYVVQLTHAVVGQWHGYRMGRAGTKAAPLGLPLLLLLLLLSQSTRNSHRGRVCPSPERNKSNQLTIENICCSFRGNNCYEYLVFPLWQRNLTRNPHIASQELDKEAFSDFWCQNILWSSNWRSSQRETEVEAEKCPFQTFLWEEALVWDIKGWLKEAWGWIFDSDPESWLRHAGGQSLILALLVPDPEILFVAPEIEGCSKAAWGSCMPPTWTFSCSTTCTSLWSQVNIVTIISSSEHVQASDTCGKEEAILHSAPKSLSANQPKNIRCY